MFSDRLVDGRCLWASRLCWGRASSLSLSLSLSSWWWQSLLPSAGPSTNPADEYYPCLGPAASIIADNAAISMTAASRDVSSGSPRDLQLQINVDSPINRDRRKRLADARRSIPNTLAVLIRCTLHPDLVLGFIEKGRV